MLPESTSQHILSLARELLDDLELGRLTGEALVLKATRLARLTGTEEIRRWLKFELGGYNSTEPLSLDYMGRTGRWVDRKEKKGHWGPLARQEATVDAYKLRLQSLTTQGIGGEGVATAVHKIANDSARIANAIATHSAIKSRVLGLLHDFVSSVYYEKLFSTIAETIFGDYKERVDSALANVASDVLERLPSAYNRLAEGDREAVSQALATCRRLIDSVADSLYPPTAESIEVEGRTVELGAQHHQNRLNVFIASRTQSTSRRKRLRQTLANLYERVSAGVHSDVIPSEARALVLSTYLLLGELAAMQSENASSS